MILIFGLIAFNALVGIVTQAHTMGNCAAGKSEMDGRVGCMCGALLKRLCTSPWCLTGFAAVVYFAGREIPPDNVFGAVAGDFLPKVLPGMLGLFIAALVASVMSSCDVFMISSSALFTEDVYRRFHPQKPRAHYVLVGRVAAVLVVGGGVYFAYWLPGVVAGLEIFWKIAPMMGIAFWLGLFWRRATVAGAWAATLTAFGLWWVSTQGWFLTCLASIPSFVIETSGGPQMSLPWQMILYLFGGTLAGILVSLVTRPVSQKKLDNFYALIRTPVQANEEVLVPCTLPADAVVPEKRVLWPNTSLEIMRPSLCSMLGFAIGWVCAAAFIGLFYGIII